MTLLAYFYLFRKPPEPAFRPVYPAQGTVRFYGAAPVGAQIMLIPEEKKKGEVYAPAGTIGADGGFHLTTYTREDGAPAGRYQVAFTWSVDKKERMPAHLTSAKTSGITVEIKAEQMNELGPFELK